MWKSVVGDIFEAIEYMAILSCFPQCPVQCYLKPSTKVSLLQSARNIGTLSDSVRARGADSHYSLLSMVVYCPLPPVIPLPVVLHDGQKDNFSEGNQLCKDQPGINHLYVGSGGKLVHHSNEDGGEDQHGGKVDCQGSLKVERFKEGCSKCGEDKKN